MKTGRHYHAYLLRCWKEPTAFSQKGEKSWRFLVEEIFGQKHRRGFADFEAAMAFLREQLLAAQEATHSEHES